MVGIFNATPDSYFDGGKFVGLEAARARVAAMQQDGADWIEIGGESTGPKSKDVSTEEETNRVLPIIRMIKKEFPTAHVSIDTWKAEVAAAAILEGVSMVNDVTAGRGSNGAIFDVVKNADASLVLMYSKDATPRTTIDPKQYDDVVATIKSFLEDRKKIAIASGIDSKKIILDPGLGHFVSGDAKYSFEILARLKEFADLGCPIFISPSRKSFLAGSENLATADRLPGTIAASALAVANGAYYIRTHDVLEVRGACEIAASMRA
ncbi:dihydropteroate synthase [Candidatus Peribacteria bacterium RIFCSPHIGHO2_02_FULL_52_16]|nr:MAG: dihydropteroate synthase [Candidatus Peribacteria bacterium RIFCSPHIGHO2_01_FULL_51_35]OGJ60916.1 MAG: dihydropteroate synthase [Candidatus Peribacteria bacterium RIFCSPHIGHO2_02_FULL_52_16]